MPQIDTQALVLETREYRESSLLVTLLSRDKGRLGAMAKGARRKKSTLAAALQPFSLVQTRLSVRPSGGLATVISADVLGRPELLTADPASLARVAYAGLFAEVLTHSHENDPHSAELFDLARRFFFGLAKTKHAGSYALQYYFALLATLGFGLNVPPAQPSRGDRTPPETNGPPEPEPQPAYHLDLLQGTLLDAAGASVPDPLTDLASRNLFPLSAEALDGLRTILGRQNEIGGDADDRAVPVVNQRVGRALTRLAARLFETHLEARLRSAKFLEEMVLRDSST